jgi:ABC-type transporter Mla maintaining outer membrane lipid asymmetry ATPase subunit MlaF
MNAGATNSTRPVIEMRGVGVGSMRDPDRVVVEDVNWSVAPGEFWAVGGLQGTGKSDLLLLTGGLAAPVRGTYSLFGALMPIFEDQHLNERLRLGIVFDSGRLFNHLTVLENVSLPLRYHRNLTPADAEPEARRMLTLCELEAWADSTPGAIGRNGQKRVGLARALMLKPDVLLLDNPLAGLDLRHRAWWLGFLGQLSKGHEWLNGRPMTLVVAADDLRPWQNRARQFAVLKNRRLVILGAWDQLQAAGDELVQELLAAEPAGD